jgi:hypothetical protein
MATGLNHLDGTERAEVPDDPKGSDAGKAQGRQAAGFDAFGAVWVI